MSGRTYGLCVALAGVLAVSPDAMLLRSMRAVGSSLPDVAAAKYFFIWLFFAGVTLRSPSARAAAWRWPAWFFAGAASQLCNQLGFTFALLLTDTAKALLLISLTPLWAALLGWLFLGDELPRRTIVALGCSVVSIALVFVPRALAPSGGEVHGTLLGDACAIFTGLAQAASISVNRAAALHTEPGEKPTLLATGLSSACAYVVALLIPCDASELARLGAVPDFWACTPKVFFSPTFLLYALADATCVAVTYVASTIAPRYITGSEVALVLLLEDVTGPLCVWARFGDVPSVWTVAGGALLLVTLAGHELAGWKENDAGRCNQVPVDEDDAYHRMAAPPSA